MGVVLNKMGWYPIGSYTTHTTCNGVIFTFGSGQCGDSVRDGLIRSIIFSVAASNQASGSSSGITGIPGEHSKFP